MWLACPASVTKTKDMLRPSSKYAKEGTAAHKVAELNLQGDIFLPDKIVVEGDEYIVSPGMCRALNSYISHVEFLKAHQGSQVFLEQRIKIPHTRGMVWGTLDCGVRTLIGDLHIVDLKFGKGHLVHPDGPQLKLYALGLAWMLRMARVDAVVTLTICQPRVGDQVLRSHVTTLAKLRHWLDLEVRPAIERIRTGDLTENAGAHCRWCVRKIICAAFARRHQTYAAAAFDNEISD